MRGGNILDVGFQLRFFSQANGEELSELRARLPEAEAGLTRLAAAAELFKARAEVFFSLEY